MSDAFLLDTHIALWLDSGDQSLRASTRAVIDDCWRSGGQIFLSAVSAWEIALLVDGGRIDLDLPVDAWVKRFVSRPGVETAPLNQRAASRAYQFQHLEQRDPADRLLIATAIDLACPLITYDERILQFGSRHGRQYGFAVAG